MQLYLILLRKGGVRMGTTIDSLQIEISAESEGASSGLESLKNTLTNFKTAIRGGLGLRAVVNSIRTLAGVGGVSSAAGGINALASGLENLGRVTSSLRISSSIANQLRSISEAASGADFSGVRELATALQPLSTLNQSNLRGYTSQLMRIPEIVERLDTATLDEFTSKMQQLATALRPLSTQLENVGNAFSRFPQRVSAANRAVRAVPEANGQAIQSYKDLSSMIHDAAYAVRSAAKVVAGWIQKSNEYVENANLFNVALGEYAGKAQQYADKVANVMGIDPGEWMRNQGIFYTLADGFGVVGDRAYIMSKNLTQLGYDISSFFNIPIEESMQKLQSGISGEIEPLRRLGMDLSQTRLEAIAASLGIKKAVADMNQAEKAQLRYYAVMTQVTTSHGDMARTLNSPANQLRILAASATQAARALGNIFIPVLNIILPIAIAVAKAIRTVAVSIASLFGYSLPSIDFSVTTDAIGGVSDGMDDVANGADKAGGAAKKLKSILMGFDEINQMPDMSGSGGSGGGGGAGGGGGSLSGFDFELPEYDFLSNMVTSQVDAIYRKLEPFVTWIEDHLTGSLAVITSIAGALLTWKIAKSFVPNLAQGWDILSKIGGLAATISSLVITISMVYTFDKMYAESGKPGLLIADALTTLLGSAIVGRVVEKAFGLNSIYGAAITLGVSAVTTLSVGAIHVANNGVDGKAIALSVTGIIKAAIAGAMVGGATGAAVGAGLAMTVELAVWATAKINGIARNNIDNNIKWGTLELEAEKVHSYAAGLFDIDVDSKITLLTDTENDLSSASAELNTAIATVQSTLNTIQLKAELDSGDFSTWQSEMDTLVNSANNYLAESEKYVQVSISVAPTLRTDDGMDMSSDIVNALGIGSDITQTAINRAGAELGELLMKGVSEGLTSKELSVANELSASLARISAAARMGEAQGAALVSADTIISGLSEKSYHDVLAEVTAMQEDLRASLAKVKTDESIAISSQLAMYRQGLREGIYTEAEAEQVKESIRTLESDLARMDIAGSVDSAMDAVLGPVGQKFLAAFQDIYGQAFASLDLSAVNVGGFAQSWVDNLKSGMDFSEFQMSMDTKIQEVLVSTVGAERAEELLNMADVFGFTGWDILGTEVQTSFYNMMVAATSKEEVDALFAELGYSIPGTVKEGMNEAGGMVITPDVETRTVVEKLQEVANTAGSAGSAVGDITDEFSGTGKTASDELGKATAAATDATSAISATGAQAETLGTKIVEIPTGKVIAIEISNYTTIIRNLNNIADKISKLSGKTINLKIKAGLTEGAKTFLKTLKQIDSTISSRVNAVLNASQFAGGGYPRSGELFIANEAGAEMVGRIGNRTAVANQDQIGDAIFRYMEAHGESNGMDEERLASAIVSAIKASGLGTVNISGRSLVQAINRESQRMGKPALR